MAIKIITFDPVDYFGIKIFVRRLGDTNFEYMFPLNGIIYNYFVEIKPDEKQRQLALLGKGDFYTEQQLKEIRAMLVDIAQGAIRLMAATKSVQDKMSAAQENREFINKKLNK